MDIVVILLIEGSLNTLILYQLFLYMLSGFFLASLVIMFSQYVSVMNSVIYAIFFFIIGSIYQLILIKWPYPNFKKLFSLLTMVFSLMLLKLNPGILKPFLAGHFAGIHWL